MIKTTNRPKRKHPFIIIDTGQHVWLDRIQNENTYFVCDGESLSLDDNFFPVEKSALKEVTQMSRSISKSKVITPEKKTEKQQLTEFFASLNPPYNCMECSKPLYAFTSFTKRCISAHLLPKAIFKSIATNPHNILFLGASILGVCSCHNFYDQGIKERTSMKIYPYAVEQYHKHLKPCLSEADVIKANDYLGL